jgi:hypothetical protein
MSLFGNEQKINRSQAYLEQRQRKIRLFKGKRREAKLPWVQESKASIASTQGCIDSCLASVLAEVVFV